MQPIEPHTHTAQPAVFPELGARRSGPPASAAEGDQTRAHAILRRAEAQAQALVEAARQKAAAQLQEGYREGQLQGHGEALAESREQLANLLASLATAVGRVEALEDEIRSRGTELVVTLAQAVARRILQAEITADPEAILGVVRGALRALPAAGDLVVRIHPAQQAILEQQRTALQECCLERSTLRVLADPAVEPGGCLVEAPGCLVDATVTRQLEEAARRLRETPP